MRKAGKSATQGNAQATAGEKVSRPWRFKAALIVVGVILGAVLAEGAARVLGLHPQSLAGKTYLRPAGNPSLLYLCYPSNPNNEFTKVPSTAAGEWRLQSASLPPDDLPLTNLAATPWCVEDRSSDQKMRDRHYERTPTAGRIRIAMVGDSFVRGEGVQVESSLPKQLETLLGTNHFEVMNVGFAGLETRREVENAQAVYEKLAVRRILLVFIPNDIELNPSLARRQDHVNDLINVRNRHVTGLQDKPLLLRMSRIAEFAAACWEMQGIASSTAKWYLDAYDPAINQHGLTILLNDFKRLAALPECKVGIIMYPLMFDLKEGYPLAPIHARVKDLAEQAGLPVLDLAPAFAGAETKRLQVHPIDHHPNQRAHAIAATAIKRWLESEHPEFLTGR